jgi:hypothetical protein
MSSFIQYVLHLFIDENPSIRDLTALLVPLVARHTGSSNRKYQENVLKGSGCKRS